MTRRTYYVRGFNPPVYIVGNHPDPSAAWIVPAALPWASARCVRRDQLHDQLLLRKEEK